MNAVLKESKATRARGHMPKGHNAVARVAAKKRGKATPTLPNGAMADVPSPAPIAVAAKSRMPKGQMTHAAQQPNASESAIVPVPKGQRRHADHSHTIATAGRSTLEENRARAAGLGYEYLGCSDHAYELRMVGGLDLAELEEQWARIDELNALDDGGPALLKGIELNIDDEGGVDYPPEVLARFDYCIASLHHGFRQPREQATRRLLVAMENPYVDIIGHATGRLLGRRDPFELDMEAVIAKAAETGTIMELNAHPERLDLNDVHLRMARKLGVRIAINTDAHEARQFSHIRWGIATARRGWVSAAEVLNAQPLPVLRSWLKRARLQGRGAL